MKGLFAINGGASTSMLVFLAAIVDKPIKAVAPYVVIALMLFSMGLAIAAWVNFVRASAAVAWEDVWLRSAGNDRAIELTKRFRFLAACSLAFFVVGALVVGIGAARTIL